MIPDAKYYFECHITIEPVYDERLELATEIAKKHKFIIAELLMRKRKEDTESRSKNDTFMTGRHSNYEILEDRMKSCIYYLQLNGFKVWRYKIEDTIIDSKQQDTLGLIGKWSH